MQNFGQRLRELRIDKGLSIKALANEIKLSSSTICRWENNQADVPGTALIVFLFKSINYLIRQSYY